MVTLWTASYCIELVVAVCPEPARTIRDTDSRSASRKRSCRNRQRSRERCAFTASQRAKCGVAAPCYSVSENTRDVFTSVATSAEKQNKFRGHFLNPGHKCLLTNRSTGSVPSLRTPRTQCGHNTQVFARRSTGGRALRLRCGMRVIVLSGLCTVSNWH